MGTIQFIVFKHAGTVYYQDVIFPVSDNQLVITGGAATVSGLNREYWQNFFCYPGELHDLYCGLVDLIDPKINVNDFHIDPVKTLPLFNELVNVITQFKDSHEILLKFVLMYCLGLDNHYFSKLLRHILSCNHQVFDYFEDNFKQPWPVARFAKDLSIDSHKINLLFYKNYGVSAKQWLLEHRLNYAKNQLITTDKKVVDIAYDSGFSNQTHFTELFKKRYQCSPTMLRHTTI